MCTVTYTYVLPLMTVCDLEEPHHSRGVAPSGFRPLRKIPSASRRSLDRVQVPVWRIALLRSAMHGCLGKPFLTELADAARSVYSDSQTVFHFEPCGSKYYPVLAPVCRSYPSLIGRLSTCYSPVRR